MLIYLAFTPPKRTHTFYPTYLLLCIFISAIVYVIDSSDTGTIAGVCADLDAILGDRDLNHLPLLLVLSKTDLSGIILTVCFFLSMKCISNWGVCIADVLLSVHLLSVHLSICQHFNIQLSI